MDEASITQYITDTLDGVDVVVASQKAGSPEAAWGDIFFFYDPDRNLSSDRRFPFATIVTKDYENFDCASNLDRPSVFRLNIGLSKETYRSLFDSPKPSSGASQAVDRGYDFAALDKLMPHPVYGSMHWVCVLNPSDATFQKVRPLLAEAHNRAVTKHAKTRSANES